MSAEDQDASPEKIEDFETASVTTAGEGTLKRQLKDRHVSMIRFGFVYLTFRV